MRAMTERAIQPRNNWSNYWKGFGFIVRSTATLRSLFRKHFIAPTVGNVINQAFPSDGIFLHAGAGTAESDSLILRERRRFFALDFVREPLLVARTQPNQYRCLMGDIKKMPFLSASVSGIWNVGVHEHFTPAENSGIFREFFRVLKPDGKIVIFWPAKYTPYMAMKTLFENIFSVFQKNFSFFPDEINKGLSRKHIRRELESAGFRVTSVTMSYRDLFIFYSAVAEKPH